MSNEILGPRREKVPRTADYAKYKANFDAIFRKKKKKVVEDGEAKPEEKKP